MAESIEYQPTPAETALLKGYTEGALTNAGNFGGALGGAPGAGGRGARFAARFLKPHTAQAVVDTPHPPNVVLERACAVIAETGRLVRDPNATGDGSVWGIVASGAMNMSPALVRVHAVWVGPGHCRVAVRGTGNEGLIKQKIGAKAVDRIVEALARP